MMDDALSSFELFRMRDPTIDISEFEIDISLDKGYNPLYDGKELNLDVTVD